jgi:hypothetical protein
VELIASAQDGQGRVARAADTVWVTGRGELWFGGQDHDRMDVLAEKASYAPGETAKLRIATKHAGKFRSSLRTGIQTDAGTKESERVIARVFAGLSQCQ